MPNKDNAERVSMELEMALLKIKSLESRIEGYRDACRDAERRGLERAARICKALAIQRLKATAQAEDDIASSLLEAQATALDAAYRSILADIGEYGRNDE